MSWMTSFFVPKHWIAGNLLISIFLPAFGAGLWNTHATLLHFISRYFATNILLHFSQQTGAGKMSIFYLFSMFPLTMSWSVFLLSLLVLLDLCSCPEWWMEYDESEPRARGIDSTLRSETCSEHQNVLRLRTVEDFRALELQWPWCLLKDKPLAICIHPVLYLLRNWSNLAECLRDWPALMKLDETWMDVVRAVSVVTHTWFSAWHDEWILHWNS